MNRNDDQSLSIIALSIIARMQESRMVNFALFRATGYRVSYHASRTRQALPDLKDWRAVSFFSCCWRSPGECYRSHRALHFR
jgi:hypothetical protein